MKKALFFVSTLLCLALFFAGCSKNESLNYHEQKSDISAIKNTDLSTTITKHCNTVIDISIKESFINYFEYDNVYYLEYVVLTPNNQCINYYINVFDGNKDITNIIIYSLKGSLPSDMENYVHTLCRQFNTAELNGNVITIY